jgi:hypothetical protein
MSDVLVACKYHPQGHSDEAKRASDNVNLHFNAQGWNAVGKWIAISLQTGDSDGILYDKKADAVRHQLHEMQCFYVRIVPGFMSYCEAEILLETNRRLYDRGWRMADPDRKDGGKQFLMPIPLEEKLKVLSILRKNGR